MIGWLVDVVVLLAINILAGALLVAEIVADIASASWARTRQFVSKNAHLSRVGPRV